MGTEYRSVRLTKTAYEELERRKRPDESFSETVQRLAQERPIADLAGVFSDEDVATTRAAREEEYRAYATERERRADE